MAAMCVYLFFLALFIIYLFWSSFLVALLVFQLQISYKQYSKVGYDSTNRPIASRRFPAVTLEVLIHQQSSYQVT